MRYSVDTFVRSLGLVPPNVNVVVSSFGGVGTSFLLTSIAEHLSTNEPGDGDGLKHIPLPPIPLDHSCKLVYVYGDPVLAAVSLFRRGYQNLQVRKLRRFERGFSDPRLVSLADYARRRSDVFGFEKHFDNWYERHLAFPTLFVRYEEVFANLDAIADHLELPASASFRKLQPKLRESAIAELDDDTVACLEETYGDLRDRLQQLPAVELREPAAARSWWSVASSPAYRRAIESSIVPACRRAWRALKG